MKNLNYLRRFSALSIMATSGLYAQDVAKTIEPLASQTKSAEEIAKELANPNTPLASLNFKNQFRWFDGALPNSGDQFSYT
ncbi:MAG: hypothetical protein AB8D78_14395, partial [Akkermansiaceae bacterium]